MCDLVFMCPRISSHTLFSWFVISCSTIHALGNYLHELYFCISMLWQIYVKIKSLQIKSVLQYCFVFHVSNANFTSVSNSKEIIVGWLYVHLTCLEFVRQNMSLKSSVTLNNMHMCQLQKIPVHGRPLYCTAMKGVIVCFTGFNRKEEVVCRQLLLYVSVLQASCGWNKWTNVSIMTSYSEHVYGMHTWEILVIIPKIITYSLDCVLSIGTAYLNIFLPRPERSTGGI